MIEDLNISRTEIDFTLDSVVVRKFENGLFDGVMLDLSYYDKSLVLAGQIVITDGNVYRPMPIKGDMYDTMPEGFQFFGVIYRSSKATDGVSIMTRGSINKYRAPYEFLAIMDEFTKACPFIIPACDCEEMEEYARLECTDGVVLTRDGKEIWLRTGKLGGGMPEGV